MAVSKPARHGRSSRGTRVSALHPRTQHGRCEAVASGSLCGPIGRLVPSGWGRAGRSRPGDPVWLVSAPPPPPSPAGREHPLAKARGVSRRGTTTEDAEGHRGAKEGRSVAVLSAFALNLAAIAARWLVYRKPRLSAPAFRHGVKAGWPARATSLPLVAGFSPIRQNRWIWNSSATACARRTRTS
jgi:hypothetical protein